MSSATRSASYGHPVKIAEVSQSSGAGDASRERANGDDTGRNTTLQQTIEKQRGTAR